MSPLTIAKKTRFYLLCLLVFSCPLLCSAEVGMYGVDVIDGADGTKLNSRLHNYQILSVYVRPDSTAVGYFAAHNFKVYLTLNIFGGKGPWKDNPDSVPVLASGEKLSGEYGGICPTHDGWRESRLELLLHWLTEFSGQKGIDGIWLDFIRYPGRWEHEHPSLPDTCYCQRCLTLFQIAKGVTLPSGLSTVELAAWIKANAELKWVDWKKEQIVSFVRDARKLVDQYSNDRKVLLGAFLVPWKKSEHKGAISFRLAQDAKLLAPYLDVLSPMVYHKMVGESVPWIRATTDYFADTEKLVWPIIQAENVGKDEFVQVVEVLNHSESDGMLVYSFRHMVDGQWPVLREYKSNKNLIPNPELRGNENLANVHDSVNPQDWFRPSLATIQNSSFLYKKLGSGHGHAIGLIAGQDRSARWLTKLEDCVPGEMYQFSANFYRRDRDNSQAYPVVSIWGHDYRLNTHRVVEEWQKLKVQAICPAETEQKRGMFQFKNNYPGTTFWMSGPQLTRETLPDSESSKDPVKNNFFPIGSYGANAENLKKLKEVGLNTAVVAMTKGNIEKCLELNMRCTLSVPRNPEQLYISLKKFTPLLELGHFSFYVNDEPGIDSFSESTARDIYDIIKSYFPDAVTNMAIVRPQAIPYYEQAADFFMLDQYPVPHMPMSWLSESMDAAAEYVGKNRLQSVIQAFGGGKFENSGWPRLPTFEEMNCLSFLSVVHGSRGIYYYTFPSITSTDKGRDDFSRLVRRLNSIRSWLQVVNDDDPVQLEMTSRYSVDPKGNDAIHCVRKEQFSTQMLICVNTINTYVEAEISVSKERSSDWVEYYSGDPHRVVDGTILSRFAPYEVKVLLESK